MAAIRLFIIDPTGGKKTSVEVPDNVELRRLVPALVNRMGLPLHNQVGNPIKYRLSFVNKGEDDERAIRPGDTLAEGGVRPGDALRLFADMEASGGVQHFRRDLLSLTRSEEGEDEVVAIEMESTLVDWDAVDWFLREYNFKYKLSLMFLAACRFSLIVALAIGSWVGFQRGSWAIIVILVVYGLLEVVTFVAKTRADLVEIGG